MITIGDLVVSLTADASGYGAAMDRSIQYLDRMEIRAAKTSAALERLGKAYAMPQAAANLQANERRILAETANYRDNLDKEGLRLKMSRMEQDANLTWQVSQRKVSAALMEYTERVSLEDRFYALTHTERETDLYNLQSYYARLRAMHQGNAEMLKLIDRSYAVESQAGAGAGGGGGFGGGLMIRRQLRYGMGMALGMHGGELGMLASSLMSLSGPAVAVTGALLLMGTAYQSVTKNAALLLETQLKHAEAVRDSVHWMEQFTKLPTTAAGEGLRDRAEELLNKASELTGRRIKRDKERGFLEGAWLDLESGWRGGYEKTSVGKTGRDEAQEAQEHMAERERLLIQATASENIASIRRAAARVAGQQAAEISGMEEGPEKRRAEFERGQINERIKFTQDYNDMLAKAAIDQSQGGKERRALLEKDMRLDKEALEKRLKTLKENFEWKERVILAAEEEGDEKVRIERMNQALEARDRIVKEAEDIGESLGQEIFAEQLAVQAGRQQAMMSISERILTDWRKPGQFQSVESLSKQMMAAGMAGTGVPAEKQVVDILSRSEKEQEEQTANLKSINETVKRFYSLRIIPQ